MERRLPLWREAEHSLSVALVNPPTITAPASLSYYGAVPPLGLAYVAAAAREAGHAVTLIDATGEALERRRPWSTGVGEMVLQGLDTDEILARVPPGTDVVGVSHMFLHQWPWLHGFLGAARRRFPEAKLVVGGENATAYRHAIFAATNAPDVCVLGEAEETFVALLSTIARGAPLDEVAGIAYREGGGFVQTGPRMRIGDVDAIARPAWDLVPVEAYLRRGLSAGVDRGRSMPVLTSRGCPYRCTFCSSPSMWTTRYTRRDPEKVLDEIEALRDRFGITNVELSDLTAMLTKEWILELCTAVRRRRLGVTLQLPTGTRSEAIDREAAEAMLAAGVRNFTYAPESGSERVLSAVKKRVKLDRLRMSLRDVVRAGIVTHGSIIIGFPGETFADLAATWRLTQRLADDGLHTLGVMIFTPYPGSAIYEELRDSGRIREDDAWLYGALLRSAGGGRSHHEHLSSWHLGTLQLAMLLTFFARQYLRRPGRVVDVLRNLAASRQHSVMDQFLATKLRQLRERVGRRIE